jgi:hypothetical protein
MWYVTFPSNFYLLQIKSEKILDQWFIYVRTYVCMYVCMYVRARARACVYVCMRTHARRGDTEHRRDMATEMNHQPASSVVMQK